jgi:hypothetical protein
VAAVIMPSVLATVIPTVLVVGAVIVRRVIVLQGHPVSSQSQHIVARSLLSGFLPGKARPATAAKNCLMVTE